MLAPPLYSRASSSGSTPMVVLQVHSSTRPRKPPIIFCLPRVPARSVPPRATSRVTLLVSASISSSKESKHETDYSRSRCLHVTDCRLVGSGRRGSDRQYSSKFCTFPVGSGEHFSRQGQFVQGGGPDLLDPHQGQVLQRCHQ